MNMFKCIIYKNKSINLKKMLKILNFLNTKFNRIIVINKNRIIMIFF